MDTNDEQYVYDLYLSVGPTCQPSENLRRNFLRDFSAPLDWMGHYSLETVLHLFRTGYDDFFKEYKIDEEREGARGDVMGNMRLVTDTLNGIDSIHHFPEFEDMDYAHRMFSDKMSERAARLERRIRSAGSVALVTRRSETKEEMLSFLRAFHDIYPHLKLLLLNFRHDDSFGFEDYEKEVVFDDGTLSYHDYLLNDTLQGKEVWFGNSYVWQKIMSQYDTPETSDTERMENIQGTESKSYYVWRRKGLYRGFELLFQQGDRDRRDSCKINDRQSQRDQRNKG